MTSTGIEVFARIRPSHAAINTTHYKTSFRDDDDTQTPCKICFTLPAVHNAGAPKKEVVNNSTTSFSFVYKEIFRLDVQQQEVFARVARPSVRSAIDGINATVFAYGQTGSGKTHTMTGVLEDDVQRGIIPRTLTAIFDEIPKTDREFSTMVSYVEVYNENAYDLLSSQTSGEDGIEDLPKLIIQEDEHQRVQLKNLSLHKITSVWEALNLLAYGDMNRQMAETPLNPVSSRSHCIFTVYLQSRAKGGETYRSSKLNLVDLAGSERVSKTNAEGQVLKEARYINLSLHFLEQVIIGLQAKDKQTRNHVPYRNSVMTTLLKDSLGGNCRTTMIATLSVESHQIGESISTCRFAQRVSLVKNQVRVNEIIDPEVVIRRLQNENRELKAQLALLGHSESADHTEDEGASASVAQRYEKIIGDYIQSPSDILPMPRSVEAIKAYFIVFKKLFNSQNGSPPSLQDSTTALPLGADTEGEETASSSSPPVCGAGCPHQARLEEVSARMRTLECLLDRERGNAARRRAQNSERRQQEKSERALRESAFGGSSRRSPVQHSRSGDLSFASPPRASKHERRDPFAASRPPFHHATPPRASVGAPILTHFQTPSHAQQPLPQQFSSSFSDSSPLHAPMPLPRQPQQLPPHILPATTTRAQSSPHTRRGTAPTAAAAATTGPPPHSPSVTARTTPRASARTPTPSTTTTTAAVTPLRRSVHGDPQSVLNKTPAQIWDEFVWEAEQLGQLGDNGGPLVARREVRTTEARTGGGRGSVTVSSKTRKTSLRTSKVAKNRLAGLRTAYGDDSKSKDFVF